MEEVDAVLKLCELQRYSRTFADEGYDNLEYLVSLDEETFAKEMSELNLKKGEWRRLYKKLHEQKVVPHFTSISLSNPNRISTTHSPLRKRRCRTRIRTYSFVDSPPTSVTSITVSKISLRRSTSMPFIDSTKAKLKKHSFLKKNASHIDFSGHCTSTSRSRSRSTSPDIDHYSNHSTSELVRISIPSDFGGGFVTLLVDETKLWTMGVLKKNALLKVQRRHCATNIKRFKKSDFELRDERGKRLSDEWILISQPKGVIELARRKVSEIQVVRISIPRKLGFTCDILTLQYPMHATVGFLKKAALAKAKKKTTRKKKNLYQIIIPQTFN